MPDEFVPCTSMYLPEDWQIEAANVAIAQNPHNRPGNSTGGTVHGPGALAVMTKKYWRTKGVLLTVGFLDQVGLSLINGIIDLANHWGRYGNIKFVYSKTDPQVRITLTSQGYWSYLGTDILLIDRGKPTMCLEGWTLEMCNRRPEVVWHEFGHTLGCPHEHMRSQIVNRLDVQKTIQYFRQTQGWTAAMTQQQVLTPLAEDSIMGTPDAEENSIMTYSLPGTITKDGRPIVGGTRIEEQDQAFIGTVYPKTQGPPPPPPPVAGMEVDFRLDVDSKTVWVNAAPGWRVQKGLPGQISEESMDKQKLQDLAEQLDKQLSAVETVEGAQAAPGGLWSKLVALVNAARAGDVRAVALAVRDILNVVLGETDGGIVFAHSPTAAAINWGSIWPILLKILAELLGR